MAKLPNQVEYLVTESDIRQQLPMVPDRFVKDYAAIKQSITGNINQTNTNTETIETLDARLDVVEGEIVVINGRLNAAENEIDTLQTDLTALTGVVDTHIASESEHGVTGNNVGTGDYCTAAVGGVVLLASAVADATTSAVVPPAALPAAGAAYVQAYAQSQTDAINALSTAMAQLVTDLNAVTTQLNALLASERIAKQLAP